MWHWWSWHQSDCDDGFGFSCTFEVGDAANVAADYFYTGNPEEFGQGWWS